MGKSILTPFRVWLVGLAIATLLTIIVAVSVGAVPVPFTQVVQIILAHLLPGTITPTWTPAADQIVWVFRLPRVLLAIIVGAALSVSGTTLQAIARNPLADPFVFGVSYGATVGAVLVLTLGARPFGEISLTVAAFFGALAAMILVYLVAQQRGRITPLRLILAGVALSYTLSAITSYLVLRASQRANNQVGLVLSWLAGSLGRARWEHLGLPAIIVILLTIYLIFQARPLNVLLMGDEQATGLGLNIEWFRIQMFVVTSLMVGAVVAVSGAIGFVGLMVPHIVRIGVGSDHRRVLPLAALGGGLFMVVVDLIGRTIIAPEELPVGIVTAAFGGPFFLWLLRRPMGE
ncbi:MAG: iron ABC transporter permease [Cyanobacteria bacterium P01_H01_bin.105]